MKKTRPGEARFWGVGVGWVLVTLSGYANAYRRYLGGGERRELTAQTRYAGTLRETLEGTNAGYNAWGH
jgi:uncharacterized membrane protein YedE/YeeE